jgi:hypothetical protein
MKDIEEKENEDSDNEGSSEDVNILESRPKSRCSIFSRSSVFSKYSAWSFRTYSRSYQITFVFISIVTIFITGMTLGSITGGFFLCDGGKVHHVNKNISYPLSHPYNKI